MDRREVKKGCALNDDIRSEGSERFQVCVSGACTPSLIPYLSYRDGRLDRCSHPSRHPSITTFPGCSTPVDEIGSQRVIFSYCSPILRRCRTSSHMLAQLGWLLPTNFRVDHSFLRPLMDETRHARERVQNRKGWHSVSSLSSTISASLCRLILSLYTSSCPLLHTPPRALPTLPLPLTSCIANSSTTLRAKR